MNATPTPSERCIEAPGRRTAPARARGFPAPAGAVRALRQLAAPACSPVRAGVALVAVGGLGRREPAPHSDLDLVLLHDGKVDGLSEIADAIWYPIWDSKVGLDHSVRTPDQAVAVAKTDLKALLGLLDIRHLAGDAGLTGRVRSSVLDVWRATAVKRLAEMKEISPGALGDRRRGGVPARAEPQGVARRAARRASAARAGRGAARRLSGVGARGVPGAARRARRTAPADRPGERRAASAGAGRRGRRARLRRHRSTAGP